MTDRPSPDGPVTLTPLEGVDLVAVAPRGRPGHDLPLAVRLVDGAVARRIAALVSDASTRTGATTASPDAEHPASRGSTARARRALNRLVARAGVDRRVDRAATPGGGW